MDPIDRLIAYAGQLYERLARYCPRAEILDEDRRKILVEGDECYRMLVDGGAVFAQPQTPVEQTP